MKLSPLAASYFAIVSLGVAGYLGWQLSGRDAREPNGDIDGTELNALKQAPPDPAPTPAMRPASLAGEHFNRPLIVAVTTRAAHAPAIVANHGLGSGNASSIYRRVYGIDVELKVMNDRAATLAAFQTGQIDMMWDTADEWALDASRLAAKSIGAKAIMLQAWSRGADGVIGIPAIGTIEELAGRRIAATELTSSYWLLLYLLRDSAMGLEQRRGVLRNLIAAKDASDAAAMVKRGEVDAAVTSEPYISAAQRDGMRVVASTAQAKHALADLLVVRQETIDQAAVALEAFIAGWLDAAEAMEQDPARARALVGEALQLDADSVAAILGGAKLASYADNAQFFGLTGGSSYFEALFDTAQRVWRKKEAGEPLTATQWYDSRFLAHLAPRYGVSVKTPRR